LCFFDFFVRFYPTDTCSSTAVINTVGRPNGACAITGPDSSMSWDWPNMDNFDNSVSCQGTPASVTPIPVGCYLYNVSTDFSTNDFDYLTFSEYSLVNPAPAPTSAPASSNSNDDDSYSSMGGIGGLAGIIIGSAVVVGLLVWMVVYCVFHKKASTNLKSPLMSNTDNSKA
jgi:hypothetical protein